MTHSVVVHAFKKPFSILEDAVSVMKLPKAG